MTGHSLARARAGAFWAGFEDSPWIKPCRDKQHDVHLTGVALLVTSARGLEGHVHLRSLILFFKQFEQYYLVKIIMCFDVKLGTVIKIL